MCIGQVFVFDICIIAWFCCAFLSLFCSGMTGGNFYKRNPLKNSRGQPIVLSDFAPGNVVSVLGRDIHITDADSFTRDFFRSV